jgi:hypothetical protein
MTSNASPEPVAPIDVLVDTVPVGAPMEVLPMEMPVVDVDVLAALPPLMVPTDWLAL